MVCLSFLGLAKESMSFFSENPNIHCKSARLYWIPEGIPMIKSQNERYLQREICSPKEIFGMHIFSDYLVCKSLFLIAV
jgi:hypothetical protein